MMGKSVREIAVQRAKPGFQSWHQHLLTMWPVLRPVTSPLDVLDLFPLQCNGEPHAYLRGLYWQLHDIRGRNALCMLPSIGLSP